MKMIKRLQLLMTAAILLLACGREAMARPKLTTRWYRCQTRLKRRKEHPSGLPVPKIVFPEENEMMERNAAFLSDFLELSTGIKPVVTADGAEEDAVILSIGLQHENPEAYRIRIDGQAIRIEGASEAAVFYASRPCASR